MQKYSLLKYTRTTDFINTMQYITGRVDYNKSFGVGINY